MPDFNDDRLNEIATAVVKFLPSLAPFLTSDERLSAYSRRINDYQPHPVHLERQGHFKHLIHEKINRLFTPTERTDLRLDSLADDRGIVGGIVEHHGLLDHPLLVSVTLVSNFYRLLDRERSGDILTFATGNVPLSEPFRRRGLMFHGQRINLFPKDDKNKVVYGLPLYHLTLVDRLQRSHRWHTLSSVEQTFIQRIDERIASVDTSTCRTLGDQYTKINYALWPLLFAPDDRPNVARLISLEYDDVVSEYLLHVLEHEPGSFIAAMLFDDRFRQVIGNEFRGIPGAWDDDRGVGSHFFWGLDAKNERVRLELHDGELFAEDAGIRVRWTFDDLAQALRAKRILPGMLLKFSLIIFFMGLKPLVGYSLEYLVRMRERLLRVLDAHFPEESERARAVPLDNMNLFSVCKGCGPDGRLEDLHALDIMDRGGFPHEYFRMLDTIPLQDFLAPSLLFAYRYGLSKYGSLEEQRSPQEFSVSDDDLQRPLQRLLSNPDSPQTLIVTQ